MTYELWDFDCLFNHKSLAPTTLIKHMIFQTMIKTIDSLLNLALRGQGRIYLNEGNLY